MIPLTHKHVPQSSSSIPQPAVQQLKTYIQTYAKQKKRAALVYGPTGSCKTSSVHAIARELNYELIEVNASEFRDSESLLQKVGMAILQGSLFGMQKLILVDEVDAVSGTKDRGALPTLLSLLPKSKYPIVLTANDPWDHKFSQLRSKCSLIEFPQITHALLVPVLKQVCVAENISHSDANLATLARRCGGDLRAALIDLQTSVGWLDAQLPEISAREVTEVMNTILMKVFKTTDSFISRDAVQRMSEDHDEFISWLDENLPKEYTKPKDLAAAYDCISRADVFRGRIMRRQHWRFLATMSDLLSAGVSHAKEQRYTSPPTYTQPMQGLRIWQLNQKCAARKSIASKLSEKTHASLRKTHQHTLPLLLAVAHANKSFAEQLTAELDLSEEEQEFLSQDRATK